MGSQRLPVISNNILELGDDIRYMAKRYSAKQNGAKESHTTRSHRSGGKNSSLHNNSSLHDTCPLPQLTKAKTEVYIITNSSYPHQEVPHTFFRQFAPCPIFPPFSRKLMLTKCRNNHHFLSGCKPLVLPFHLLSDRCIPA